MTRSALSPIANGWAGAASVLPCSLFFGLIGYCYVWGFDGLAFVMGLAGAFALWALLIAPFLRAAGAADILEFLTLRYGAVVAVAAGIIAAVAFAMMLAAELAFVGELLHVCFGLVREVAIFVLISGMVCVAVFGQQSWFSFLRLAAFVFVLATLVMPPLFWSVSTSGWPWLFYGGALSELGRLETAMLEAGLTDVDTFRAHARPFLSLSYFQFLSVALVIALGGSVLLGMLRAAAADVSQSVRSARVSAVWLAAFAIVLIISIPSLATYGKLAIYTELGAAAPAESLPGWLETASRHGFVHVYGLSARLIEAVGSAIGSGASDSAAVGLWLWQFAPDVSPAWSSLDADVQSAVIAAARGLDGSGGGDPWAALTADLMRVAAESAGDDGARLTQASVVIDPIGVLLILPHLSQEHAIWFGLLGVSVAALAVLFGGDVLATMVRASAATGGVPTAGMVIPGMLVIGAAVTAYGLGMDHAGPHVVTALSLLAAGLFVPVVLGIFWGRAHWVGCVAAIVLGAGIAGYYAAALQFAPVSFFEIWAPYSSAAEYEVEDFRTLAEQAAGETSELERNARSLELVQQGRGDFMRPGVANWFGVDKVLSGVFGLPIALLAMMLVSVVAGQRDP